MTHEATIQNIETPVDLTFVLLRRGEELEYQPREDGEPQPGPIFMEREVCAVFDRGVHPKNPALVVRMSNRPTNIPLASEIALPFLFVLIFPYGERIWHIGMRHNAQQAQYAPIRNMLVLIGFSFQHFYNFITGPPTEKLLDASSCAVHLSTSCIAVVGCTRCSSRTR
jgi:hypothetical protein